MQSGATLTSKPVIAIATGDPNGIGPEIALRAALDPAVASGARVLLVSDSPVIGHYAHLMGLGDDLAAAVESGAIAIHDAGGLEGPPLPGEITAEAGRATVASASTAIRLALEGRADAVVAAPHNETAISRAGISFNGYPGLLADVTGTSADSVFLMLVTPRFRITHLTLHEPLQAALRRITPERVAAAAKATDNVLRRFGLDQPRIAACGINPHAGEGGLFGDEDETIVRPGVEAARRVGIGIEGPRGADMLFAANEYDAYLAMYHDQGHIPVKLQGRRNALALSIGTPVLFSSVAHGSAHDIAGSGSADPAALAGAVTKLAAVLNSAAATSTNGKIAGHADHA